MSMPTIGATGMADAISRIEGIQARLQSMMGPVASLEARAGAGDDGFRLPDQQAATAVSQQPGQSAEAALQPASMSAASVGSSGGSGRATGAWVDRLPAAGRQWADEIEGAAKRAGIDPALLAALVNHESGFDPGAVSHAGAIGLGQLMPGTADGLGVDPRNPQENLDGAARYLRDQLDRFGKVDLALAAYNAGPGRVLDAGGVPRIPETTAYVERVTSTWEQWS